MTRKSEEEMIRAGYYLKKRNKEALEEEAFKQRRSASYLLDEMLDQRYASQGDQNINSGVDSSK